MRNRLILIAFLLLMGGWPAYSQQVTGNITAVDTSGACTTANGYVAVHLLSNAGSVSFVVTGTFSATLNPLVSVDGTHFKAASAYPTNSSTPVTSMTAAGTWTVGVAGMVTFCVDASAYASGTATITIRPSNAVSISAITGGGGGGGGSGTVTEVDTTAPLSGGPITGSGTIACATCAIGPGSSTANHVAEFANTDGVTLKDGGAASNGISGQASGVIPLGSTATTIGAQSHCDDGVTTSATVTCTEPITSSGAGTFGGSGPSTFSAGIQIEGGSTLSTSNQTGTGNIVLATNPTLVTPALGTPSALVLTNATGLPGASIVSASVTATQLAAQYSKGQCTELWGGSGTSFAMTSGDDAISNNSCYNDSGVTRTITAVKCRADNASNTTVLTPTFGSAGTGTAILTGTLTCGNSYAYSSTGTVNSASWTTGTGIDPGMSTVGNATSIALLIEYTF